LLGKDWIKGDCHMKSILVWSLILLVSAIASLVVGSIAVSCISDGKPCDATQRVTGIITDSKVAINGSEKEPNWVINIWFNQRPHWDLTVWFSYEVNGIRYTGKQQWYTVSNYKEKAQTERLYYLPGKIQNVYYAPSNPTRSLIEPAKLTIKMSDVGFISSGVAGVVVGAGICVFARHRKWIMR
jgi:hypothetical protein